MAVLSFYTSCTSDEQEQEAKQAKRIKVGMTKRQVVDIMGYPKDSSNYRDDNGNMRCGYCYNPINDDFIDVAIEFDLAGKVVHISGVIY